MQQAGPSVHLHPKQLNNMALDKLRRAERFHLLRKYMQETPLHGFGILTRVSGLWDTLIWVILLTVCAGFTVRDIMTFVEVYRSEPTATTVTVQHSSDIKIDKVTVCVDVNADLLLLSTDSQRLTKLLNEFKPQLEILKVNA